jgi:lipoyl(octanoyl) transferase
LRLGPTSLGCDVVGYVRDLEEALIEACRALGLPDAHRKAERDDSGAHLTGVWCEAPVVAKDTLGCNFLQIEKETCKLIAIGVGLSGGVTRHGFALNVTTDLELYLKHIVPCGLSTRGVTSLDRALGRTPKMDDVKRLVTDAVLKRIAPRHRLAA